MEEQNFKIKVFIVIFLLVFVKSPLFAIDYSLPPDVLTIEALIDLHKQIKKKEQASLAQAAIITTEQEKATDLSNKISDLKTTLNKRMNDVNSFIVLASTITATATNLEKLISEYNDFITIIGPMVVKKPYCSIYYANAQKHIISSVLQLKTKILAFTVNQSLSFAGIDVFIASSKEKFIIINQIDSTITQLRYLIHNASNYIRYAGKVNMIIKSADILCTDEYKQKLSQKLIEKWGNTTFPTGTQNVSN